MGRVIVCNLVGESCAPLDFSELQPEYRVGRDELFDALEREAAEVVVIRSAQDDPVAHECLRELALRWPWIIRIQLNIESTARYQSEAGDVADASIPDGAEVSSRVDYIVERTRPIIKRLRNPAIESLLGDLGELPSPPEQVAGLNRMIDRQVNKSAAPVAPLFRGCTAYLKRLMELLNNPLFGSDRHLFSINEAVHLVGLRTLRDLSVLTHIMQIFPQPDGWSCFSFEHLLNRSLVCARLAERIAHSVGADRIGMCNAFAAGLLHDFGMAAMVCVDPERYHRAMGRAGALNQPIYAIEKLEYNLTHGELGASILRRWGIAPRVVRAVLYHHVPKAAGDNAYSTLTAAHVADALVPPLFNTLDCHLGGHLSLTYLDHIGQMDKRSLWESMGIDHGTQLAAYR